MKFYKAGGLVAFPTDTVYGVGALAFDGKAVELIYAAKDRPVEKAIPILIGDSDDLEKVGIDIPGGCAPACLPLLAWTSNHPCPETRSTSPKPSLPPPPLVCVCPTMRWHAALLRLAGPMAVTSANISGAQSPVTAQEVYEQLGGRIPLIIDGGKTPGGVPSTLVDCTVPELKILREGPISVEELHVRPGQFGLKNS